MLSFVRLSHVTIFAYVSQLIYLPGQRLAAQKGESDDIFGAMKAQERQNATEALSDDEDE